MSSCVVLPLAEDQLWDVIENGQKEVIVVDVAGSFNNLGNNILYYISNAGIDVQFDWEGCDDHIKQQVMLSYINMNRLYKHDQLINTLMDLMMVYKDIPGQLQGIFTEEQCIDFINNNLQLFATLVNFLDSVVLLVGKGFKSISCAFDPEHFEQVVDPSISLNVINLFYIPEFAAFYGVLDIDNLKWYQIQFTKPLYDNNFLDNIVFGKNSGLAAAAAAVLKIQGKLEE